MKITIDRIESGIVLAELQNGQLVEIPGELFPGATEGDIYMIEKDTAEAGNRRQRINDKMSRLFTDENGGGIGII